MATVDDRADALAASQQRGIACPMAVVARVVLNQVGVGRLDLTDEHRHPGAPGARRLEEGIGAPGALGKDEPHEVGARLGQPHRHRPGRVRPQDAFHERAAQELTESGARIRCAHQRLADEHGVRPCQLGRRCLRGSADAALGNQHAVAWHQAEQLQLAETVDLEGRQVSCVDADHGRGKCRRSANLLGVVRLDQGVETQCLGLREQRRTGCVVEVAQEQEGRVRACLLRLPEVLGCREEAFCKQRQSHRRASGAQVVQVPPKRSSTRTDIARPGRRDTRVRSP